jgi:hypothetical protein
VRRSSVGCGVPQLEVRRLAVRQAREIQNKQKEWHHATKPFRAGAAIYLHEAALQVVTLYNATHF